MPTRHGALLTGVDPPQFCLGIWQVFAPWIDPRLQWLQGYNVPAITRPLTIEFHFRHVVYRLVRSLTRLHQRIREWDEFLEAGGLAGAHPELVFDIPEEGGIAADSVFHYLNLFIDDLARVIPFVLTDDGTEAKEVDGFSALKRMLITEKIPASPPLRKLFAELDCDDSWWFCGFRPGGGIRQRLTHYTDLVFFQGSTKPGDARQSGDISLSSVGGPIQFKDFELSLQELFRMLCEWLDRLDPLLLVHLSEGLAIKGVSWNPLSEACRTVALPRWGDIRVDLPHYLYLPVCNPSARTPVSN